MWTPCRGLNGRASQSSKINRGSKMTKKYRATKDIATYIGGRFRKYQKGASFDIEPEAVEQNLEPDDYEVVETEKKKNLKFKKFEG